MDLKTITNNWQMGDGREEACLQYVRTQVKAGDVTGAIDAIDEFARKTFLINVGDKKGLILDNVIEKQKPKRVLELGAYVGYSALRIAAKLPPGGHLYSIEFNAENARITREVLKHAGVSDRVTVVHGYLSDGGKTITALRDQYGFALGCLDVVFIDHSKEAYVPDLMLILNAKWLHRGSVVLADNVLFPGAPEYRAYMESEEGKTWKTIFHEAHLEYREEIPDLVLESTLLTGN